MEQETFTVEEAAAWLKISTTNARELIKRGDLVVHRPMGPKGRIQVVHIDDLRDCLKSSPTNPT